MTDAAPPRLPYMLREAGSLLALRVQGLLPVRTGRRVGSGEAVMVIPGFLASDRSTMILRQRLQGAGYRVHGWGRGINFGVKADLFDRLEARLAKVGHQGPVTLIGWSLGGLYARELAKRQPDKVARVITLGSPFSGDLRANNAWRLYEMVNRHKVDAPPVDVTVHEKPPVPTIALWSRKDGIVAPASARGLPGEVDKAVELDCTHIGFMTAPCVIDAVLEELAVKAD
ncbi:esterase/lipase family protein [Allosphingosinicella vermicomposti]|uniref:esterase/lipase family protein n=1 Tax=Allosphingosinicella vermicomposti TaxID=614671 RepID=UPI0018F8993E|nr:lipase family protein [Allosphingosinicella vermicomposti]